MMVFAMAQVGKPYDNTAIEAFVFGRDWRQDDAWFCSELAAACLEQANAFSHKLATPVNKIDPCMLFALASTVGELG
jgi:hypothetical protein